jgi:hypothetical protein
MSGFLIHPASGSMDHIKERVDSLFLFNELRVMELMESIQYGLGYLVLGFISGVVLDYSFPKFDEETKTRDLFVQLLGQGVALIVLIFYVRKIVKIMPFMFMIGRGDGYKPYYSNEYNGEIMIALMIVGAQFNLIKKIDLLSRRLYRWIFNEEKSIGLSLGI